MKYEGLNKTGKEEENVHLKDIRGDGVHQDSLDVSSGKVTRPFSLRRFYETSKIWGFVVFLFIFILMMIGMPEFRSAFYMVVYWGLVAVALEFWPLFLLLLVALVIFIIYFMLSCVFHF